MSTIGKFEILESIGSGCFGKVFKVKDELLEAERALKIIKVTDPDGFIKAFNEAKILEKCRHSNIVDIKEVDIMKTEEGIFPYIVTEYLKNGSVQSYLENNFISVHQSIKIISEALLGVEHAHNQGILHRDIKPGNILFSDTGEAKLSDFGLAYGLPDQAFNFEGYNAHLPLEVLEEKVQDELSDLYSMGITLYRLLNNIENFYLPFNNSQDMIKALKKEQFPKRNFSEHIPNSVIKIVKKSIKKDRGSRYQNCRDFRQALQKIPLAIEWKPKSDNHWEGTYKNDTYSIELSEKRTGYFIDFKKNNRKVSDRSCVQIKDINVAKTEFFKIIRDTTIEI